jgi:hypothetical protein
MKTGTYKIIIPALVVAATLMALSLVTSSRVIAQANTQQFKVGDRVEVETNSSQHPENSTYWRKGTKEQSPASIRLKITLAALSSRWMKTVVNSGIVLLISSGSALRKEPTRRSK